MKRIFVRIPSRIFHEKLKQSDLDYLWAFMGIFDISDHSRDFFFFLSSKGAHDAFSPEINA